MYTVYLQRYQISMKKQDLSPKSLTSSYSTTLYSTYCTYQVGAHRPLANWLKHFLIGTLSCYVGTQLHTYYIIDITRIHTVAFRPQRPCELALLTIHPSIIPFIHTYCTLQAWHLANQIKESPSRYCIRRVTCNRRWSNCGEIL